MKNKLGKPMSCLRNKLLRFNWLSVRLSGYGDDPVGSWWSSNEREIHLPIQKLPQNLLKRKPLHNGDFVSLERSRQNLHVGLCCKHWASWLVCFLLYSKKFQENKFWVTEEGSQHLLSPHLRLGTVLCAYLTTTIQDVINPVLRLQSSGSCC